MRLATLLSLTLLATQLPAVEYATREIDGKKITVCTVDVKKEKLELFLRDEAGKNLKSFKAIDEWLANKDRKLAFAMNAGMYHPDYTAVGLFVADGRQQYPLNFDSAPGNFFLKPNGVFAITDRGAVVMETQRFSTFTGKVHLATQSGPMLVIDGKLHPAFKRDSISRLFRNGVGVASPDKAHFAITEAPVNFDEFARFFRDVLKCPNALFFDGTVSSLHSLELGRSEFKIDLGPIIGITAPK